MDRVDITWAQTKPSPYASPLLFKVTAKQKQSLFFHFTILLRQKTRASRRHPKPQGFLEIGISVFMIIFVE
jgi:hypothetical protein